MVEITSKENSRTHDFYCDVCKEHLGTRIEDYEGFVFPLGRVEMKICVPYAARCGYRYRKNLCVDCRIKEIERFTNFLSDFGFKN